METINSIVANYPPLRSMRPQHRNILCECASQVVFEPGEVIFHEGTPATAFYLIQHGRVIVEAQQPRNLPLKVQELSEGELLGWSWLFPPFQWHFSATATERTAAVAFNGAHLLIACEDDPELGYDLMKRISQLAIQRLQAFRRRAIRQTFQPEAEPTVHI